MLVEAGRAHAGAACQFPDAQRLVEVLFYPVNGFCYLAAMAFSHDDLPQAPSLFVHQETVIDFLPHQWKEDGDVRGSFQQFHQAFHCIEQGGSHFADADAPVCGAFRTRGHAVVKHQLGDFL